MLTQTTIRHLSPVLLYFFSHPLQLPLSLAQKPCLSAIAELEHLVVLLLGCAHVKDGFEWMRSKQKHLSTLTMALTGVTASESLFVVRHLARVSSLWLADGQHLNRSNPLDKRGA